MSTSENSITDNSGPDMPSKILTMAQTKADRQTQVWPLFTTFGNRIELNRREKELYNAFTNEGKEGPPDEHQAMCEKVSVGFESQVDERMEAYSYEPLPTQSSIRLVQILPEGDDGMIRLSLEAYDMSKDVPTYDCLSYTWGNPHANVSNLAFRTEFESDYDESVTWPIQCDGRLMRVRRNLFDALRMMPENRVYDKISEFASMEDSVRQAVSAQMSELMADFNDEGNAGNIKEGQTPLIVATIRGYTTLCKQLINLGHDPYEKDSEGLAAKDYAVQYGHLSLSSFIEERQVTDRRLIWIDAICIDQTNLSERSSQVQMMGQIYTQAESVVVWLGLPDGVTRFGIQALQKLTPHVVKGELLVSKIVPFDLQDQSKTFEAAGIPNIAEEEWIGLASIYLRQYFRRVWSLQEAVLAKSTTAYIGQMEIPWDVLLFLAHEFKRMDKYSGKSLSTSLRPEYGVPVEAEAEYIWECRMRHTLDDTTAEKRQQWFEDSGNTFKRGEGKLCRQPLFEHLADTATLLCSDPRDRIYGLLGLAGNHPESPKIVPDYRRTLPELWAEVTRHEIESTEGNGPTGALSIFNMMRDTTMSQVANLPSWVPDYGRVGRAALNGFEFRAHGGTHHVPKVDDVWNQLSVKGIKVDVIQTTGNPRDMSPKLTMFNLDPSWFELALKLDPVYHTGQSRTEVLWRTLCADQLAVSRQDYGRGESPAPPRYGKQFTDLVCAMILAARDATAEAEGRPKLNALSIEMMRQMFQISMSMSVKEEEEEEATLTVDQMVDLTLMINSFTDELTKKVMDLLVKLETDEKDENFFTPTMKSIVAYVRAPTYRLNESGFSFHALDRTNGGFVERFSAIYGYRRLYITQSQYFGLGPASMEIGDEVWVLAGSDTPVVLRPQAGPDDRLYRLIGETYLHGFMRGEALSQKDGEFTQIVLV